MAESTEPRSWLVLLTRLPTEPARHRMALWRELRRGGAVLVGQSAWALPDLAAVRPVVERVRELAAGGGGEVLVLHATGYDDAAAGRLQSLYEAEREREWAEFVADCGKYLAELDREEAIGKFTLAELEEEEQSLDRLRRWYRDLRARDLLGTAAALQADQQLKECVSRLDGYAERVYAEVSGGPAR